MHRRSVFSILAATLALAGLALASALPQQPPASDPAIPPSNAGEGISKQAQGPVPTEAELHARAQRIIANQHRNDNEIEQFDRIERHLDRTGGPNPRVLVDRVYRVVPTGSGTLKILLKDGATPTDPAEYRQQLQSWEALLEMLLSGNNVKAKTERDKFERRMHERSEFIDAIDEAFLAKPLGQETVGGRACDVFELDPNPAYRPRSLFQDALAHVTAKIWVDRQEYQLVRGEAHVTRDISFGGGILGNSTAAGLLQWSRRKWLPEYGCRSATNTTLPDDASCSPSTSTKWWKRATIAASDLRTRPFPSFRMS